MFLAVRYERCTTCMASTARFHGFVETGHRTATSRSSRHPDNPKDIEWGVTHAGNPGGAVTVGGMQHVALHVDTLDEVLKMRDRIRSRRVQVIGPRPWLHQVDLLSRTRRPEPRNHLRTRYRRQRLVAPAVVGLCGISRMRWKHSKPCRLRSARGAVAQPAADPDMPTMHWPEVYDLLVSMSDKTSGTPQSEPTPPVIVADRCG